MNKLSPAILSAKNLAEIAINEFYLQYSGESKRFKVFSIECNKSRIILKLSSVKKNDNFLEYGTKITKISGGNDEK